MGCGRVGLAISIALTQRGHSVAVVDKRKEAFGGGNLMDYRLVIPDHLTGRPISSVESPGSITVAGVERGGTGFIPVDGSTFQQGDVAHFVLTKDSFGKLDTLLEPVSE